MKRAQAGQSCDQVNRRKREITTKDPYARDKFTVPEVLEAFRNYPQVKAKERAIKALQRSWKEKCDFRFSEESNLYEALTHYKLANAFNREQNLKGSESWNCNNDLRWFGEMVVDTCLLSNLQAVFKHVSGRQLEEEKNRLLGNREKAEVYEGRAFGLLRTAEKLNLRSVMLVEGDADKYDERFLEHCALAIIGAAFVDGGYSTAERLVDGWLFEDLFKLYESEEQLLYSLPLSEELEGPTPKAQLANFFHKFPSQFRVSWLLENSQDKKFVYSLNIEDYYVPKKRIDHLTVGAGRSIEGAQQDAAKKFIQVLENDERNVIKRLNAIKSSKQERFEHQQMKIEVGAQLKRAAPDRVIEEVDNDDHRQSQNDKVFVESVECSSSSHTTEAAVEEERGPIPFLVENDLEEKYRIRVQNDDCILKNINELVSRYSNFFPGKADWEEWQGGTLHQKLFTAKLSFDGRVYAIATSTSKKRAKKKAASMAYPKLFY